MTEDERVHVGPVGALEAGERRTVVVDGTPVGVLAVDGELYALENECRHDGGPVCTGTVRDRLEAAFTEPGRRVEEDYTGRPTITCPWHGWEYDLATGVHIGDASYALGTYEVTVEDGEVYVSTGADG